MIVNPAIYGSSSADNYITDNIIWLYENYAGSSYHYTYHSPALYINSTNGLTLEICCTVTAPSSTASLISIDNHNFSIDINNNSEYLGQNSDYAIQTNIGSNYKYYTIDDLRLNEQHTFSYTSNSEETILYIDGTQRSTLEPLVYSSSFIRELGMMCIPGGNSVATGSWKCARVYKDKALTAAEIQHNYAVDLAKYGEQQ